MTWSPHIRQLRNKLEAYASIFRMISSSAGGCSVESLIKLYNALCEGLLRYSLPALEPLTKTNSRLLEGLQAKVLRVCLGVPKNTSTLGTLRESRRLSPTVLCQQELLRARLRFVTRTVDHPLACDSEAEVRALLPAVYQSPPEHTQPPWTFACWKITLILASRAKLSCLYLLLNSFHWNTLHYLPKLHSRFHGWISDGYVICHRNMDPINPHKNYRKTRSQNFVDGY